MQAAGPGLLTGASRTGPHEWQAPVVPGLRLLEDLPPAQEQHPRDEQRHLSRTQPRWACTFTRRAAGGAAQLHEEGADLAPGRELGHFRVRRSPLKALHRVEKPGQDLDVPAG